MNVTVKRIESLQKQLEAAESLLHVARTDLTTTCNNMQFNRIAKQLRRAIATASLGLNRIEAFAENNTTATSSYGAESRPTGRNRTTAGSCSR